MKLLMGITHNPMVIFGIILNQQTQSLMVKFGICILMFLVELPHTNLLLEVINVDPTGKKGIAITENIVSLKAGLMMHLQW